MEFFFFALPIFLLLFAAEVLWYRKKGLPYPWKDTIASIKLYLGNTLISVPTGAVVLYAASKVFHYRLFDINMDSMLSWVILFFLLEFTYYVFHYYSHRSRLAWASHGVHHTSNDMNIAVSIRLGWTDFIAFGWAIHFVWILVGFPVEAVFTLLGTNLLYQAWLHTKAIKRGPGWYEYIFNTPSHHRVHHSRQKQHLDCNFGGVLILYDRMFKTFVDERDTEPCEFGVTTPIHSYKAFDLAFFEWKQMLKDLQEKRGLKKLIRTVFGPPGG